MMTVEERLEAMKETVADQRAKINDLDRKVDDLERALRDVQAVSNIMMRFLKDKFTSEFIERMESNL